MNLCDCKNNRDCTLAAVVASVIIGVVAAFLNFSATITIPLFVYWIFFGVALIFLALSLLVAPFTGRGESRGCLCTALSTFLFGIFGTVLLSLVLVLVDIAATGLLASVLIGLLFASLALTVTSVACLIKCLFNCN